MPAPKSLSSAQKAAITGPGTPYCCSTLANRSRCCLSFAAPLCRRFCEISLAENDVKLWAKKLCLRSRAMMPGSMVMPSRAAEIVAREMPLAAASWRKAASQRSKLPVFWQLALAAGVCSADAGGAACARQHHDNRCQVRRRLAHEWSLPMLRVAVDVGADEGSQTASSSASALAGPAATLFRRRSAASTTEDGSRSWAKLEGAHERGLGGGKTGDRPPVGRVDLDEGVGLRLLQLLIHLQHGVGDGGA